MYSICDECKDAARKDVAVQKHAEVNVAKMTELMEEENPPLTVESDEDELRCDICDVTFQDIQHLRRHYTDSHPDNEVKYKRGIKQNDDGKRGRRTKNIPSKSL